MSTAFGRLVVTRKPEWGAAGILAAAALGFLLVQDPYHQRVLTLTAIYALAGIGVNLLVGYTGIVTVGHAAIMCIGGYAWAVLQPKGFSQVSVVLIAVLFGTAAGLLLGILCLRLREHYQAVATLAFGLLVYSIAKNWESMTNGDTGILGVQRFALPFVTGPIVVYVAAMVVLAVCFWLQGRLRESSVGLSLLAVRGDELAASTSGLSVDRVRLLAFTLSAVPAAFAGVLIVQLDTYANPGQFTTAESIFLLAVPILGGRGWLWAPILGSVLVMAIPEYFRALSDYRLILYGALLAVVGLFFPGGLVDLVSWGKGRLAVRRLRHNEVDAAGSSVEGNPVPSATLVLEDVSVHFGGVAAVSNLQLEVPTGRVVCLVGPNGAGKSTALNLASGFYPTQGGEIRLDRDSALGSDLTRLPPEARARLGIQRTFQTPRLFPQLTVLENVLVPLACATPARWPRLLQALGFPPAVREYCDQVDSAYTVLRKLGLAERANDAPLTLALGDQRLVEVARALAVGATFVLLDEPFAGLGEDERQRVVAVLRSLVTTHGVGVLLVEHNLDVVRSVADEVVVMDQGRLLTQGLPEEVLAHPLVRRAYFGEAGIEGNAVHPLYA